MKKILVQPLAIAAFIAVGIFGLFAMPYVANYRTPFLGHGAGVYIERPQGLFSHITYRLYLDTGKETLAVYDFSLKRPFLRFLLVEYSRECQCVTSAKKWDEFVYRYPPYTEKSLFYYVSGGKERTISRDEVMDKLEAVEPFLKDVRKQYSDTIRNIANNTYWK